jgi:lambda family phage portal protein
MSRYVSGPLASTGLLDAQGRSVYRVLSPAYQGAGTGRRSRGWRPPEGSPNALVAWSLPELRRRSRDAARNNPHARSALETLTSNIVGTGIVPLPTTEDAELKKALQEAWLAWTDEADADAMLDLYGLQSLAVSEMAEAGEVLVRFRRRRPEDGLTVPLQLQLIEPEHLDATETRRLDGDRRIVSGIEYDAIGRRVAYHLYRDHPRRRVQPRCRPAEGACAGL